MTFLPLLLLLIAFPQTDEGAHQLVEQLDAIHQAYLEVRSSEDIGGLVELDGRLRSLVDEPWRQERRSFDGRLWKPTWKEIGIWVSHYGDNLVYSGKLLVEAHAIDPTSPYRRFTLFSSILGELSDSGLGEMPDINVALQYLDEFPDGPFADETMLILGNFYNDLYKVLRGVQEGRAPDYKLDCFSKYVEKRDLSDQAAEAQRLSIKYYSQVLELRTGLASEWYETKDIRRWMQKVKDGTATGWHFCAD